MYSSTNQEIWTSQKSEPNILYSQLSRLSTHFRVHHSSSHSNMIISVKTSDELYISTFMPLKINRWYEIVSSRASRACEISLWTGSGLWNLRLTHPSELEKNSTHFSDEPSCPISSKNGKIATMRRSSSSSIKHSRIKSKMLSTLK